MPVPMPIATGAAARRGTAAAAAARATAALSAPWTASHEIHHGAPLVEVEANNGVIGEDSIHVMIQRSENLEENVVPRVTGAGQGLLANSTEVEIGAIGALESCTVDNTATGAAQHSLVRD